MNRFLLTIALSVVLLTSCSQEEPLARRTQILMGTLVEIALKQSDAEKSRHAVDLAFDEIKRIENLFSSYLPDSDISRLNRSAGEGWETLSSETIEVLKRAQYWSEWSQGAFDITVGPAVALWKFDEAQPTLPSSEQIDLAVGLIDYRDIQIKESQARLARKGMSVQLGAIGKGYAVDRAIKILQEEGISDAFVNAGGDLKSIGMRSPEVAWKIGLQHPRYPDKMIGAFSLSKRAIATSGDYQKYFIQGGHRYHHILNPKTGRPAEESGVISATVLANSVMDADAIATALFIMGPQALEKIRLIDNTEAMVILKTGKTFFTPGFQTQPGFIYRGFEPGMIG
jgi:FAD:protein FMN transferase